MNILYDALEELKKSPKSVILSRKVHALLHRESRFAAFKRIMCEIIKNIIQRQKSGLNNCFMLYDLEPSADNRYRMNQRAQIPVFNFAGYVTADGDWYDLWA